MIIRMSQESTLKNRWDLSPLFKSDSDPEIDKSLKKEERLVRAFAKKWSDRIDYLQNETALKESLDEFEKLLRNRDVGRATFYFSLRTAQDQIDQKLKVRATQIDDFSTKLQNILQFYWLKLGTIDEKRQHQFLRS